MRICLPALAFAAICLGAPAMAQTSDPQAADPPPGGDRVRQVIVYGDDPCPRGGNPDEIVVCARRPDSERYRIPEALRDKSSASGGTSWAAQVEDSDRMSDGGIGSCSTTGSGGASGCWAEMVRQYRRSRNSPPPFPD